MRENQTIHSFIHYLINSFIHFLMSVLFDLDRSFNDIQESALSWQIQWIKQLHDCSYELQLQLLIISIQQVQQLTHEMNLLQQFRHS
jgi:hypothetical protein